MRAKPLCFSPASINGTSCCLSPEKLRATKVAPSVIASSTGSIGGWKLVSPFFALVPMSAEAENCPFVNPYTPLFSMMYSMFRLRRMAWQNCPSPIDRVSPSPETPMKLRLRFAALAPMAIDGMRPWTELNPWPPLTKYAVVFEEQPMPESFTTFCGSSDSSQAASTIAAVIESWPHPAHRVDSAPSYCRRVNPSAFLGREGWATLGFARNVMWTPAQRYAPAPWAVLGSALSSLRGRISWSTPSTMNEEEM